jgi:hypothetical protein
MRIELGESTSIEGLVFGLFATEPLFVVSCPLRILANPRRGEPMRSRSLRRPGAVMMDKRRFSLSIVHDMDFETIARFANFQDHMAECALIVFGQPGTQRDLGFRAHVG